MPELPEVETVRRGLEQHSLHRPIAGVRVANAKVLKGQSESVFAARCEGRCLDTAMRRGKYLLLSLSPSPLPSSADAPPLFLCVHLKMRGQLRVEKAEETPGPYLCVSLVFADGGALRFYDMWTWGEMRALTASELESVAGLRSMGPEPLDGGWGAVELEAKLRGKRTAIKPTLLDQSVVAGVGNIYADESLFRSGIHPQRAANSLTAAETERLAAALVAVLTAAVGGGGTTSEEFRDLSGVVGGYTPLVYDRGGEPCPRCENPLQKIRLGGRGTTFCPLCQV